MAHAELLCKILAKTQDGLTLAELMARQPRLARRTVQRWVAQLQTEGRITAAGAGRARRYFASGTDTLATPRVAATFPDFIPVSADSLAIIAYLEQPEQARKPVGYQREFLDAYQPNKTWYLTEAQRRQ